MDRRGQAAGRRSAATVARVLALGMYRCRCPKTTADSLAASPNGGLKGEEWTADAVVRVQTAERARLVSGAAWPDSLRLSGFARSRAERWLRTGLVMVVLLSVYGSWQV